MQREHYAVLTTVFVALALLAVGAFAAFGSAGAAQQPDEPSAKHMIHVSAVGEADAEPDRAVLHVSVTAEGEEIEPVRDELAAGSEELTNALDELGVEYETTNYDIEQPRQPREERELPEYVGRHSFEITLEDPDQAGTVIDEAVGAGAKVDHVRLTLSDERRNELRDQAIENALDDARQQADTIADTTGLEVSSVSTVDASQRNFHPVSFNAGDEAVAEDGAAPTEIASGDVTVSYNVDVTYNATSS